MINRRLVLGGIALVSFIFLIFILGGIRGAEERKRSAGTLKVWGVFETNDNIHALAKEYAKIKPKIKIEYRNFTVDEYENLLIGEIAEGDGPDIAFIHNTWLPRHHAKFAPLSEDPVSIELMKTTFVQAPGEDLIYNGKVYAMPLYVDSLALYYNLDHYQDTVIRGRPAETWQELQNDLLELNVPDASAAGYARSGLALGTANNISRASDILYLLLLQRGQAVYPPDFDKLSLGAGDKENILAFYTSFADKNKSYASWNESFNYYTDVFADGKVSTIVGFAYLLPEVKSKTERKRLTFATAPIPQQDPDNPVNLASYWALAINRNSQNWVAAAEFIQFLTLNKDTAAKYFALTQKPPARRDLIEEHQNDPYLGSFARSALSAKTFPIFDNGRYDRLFEEAVNKVNTRKISSREALQTVEDQLNQFLTTESTLRE